MLYILRKRISGLDYNYSDYLFAPLRNRDDIKLIDFVEIKRKGILEKLVHEVVKKVQTVMPSKVFMNRIFGRDFIEKLDNISSSDRVLIFDIWNLKYQLLLNRYLKGRDVKSYIWDSVSAFYKTDQLKKNYLKANEEIHIYTFDPADACRYGFGMAGQVYRCDPDILQRCKTCPETEKIDIFYVGKDLGRTELFAEIIQSLNCQNLNSLFWIVPPKDKKRVEALAPYYIDRFIPYDLVLDQIVRCRCLLEIVKPRQTGWTLRTLEALFYGKKLITNNKEVLNAPFYNKSNIYIIGHDEPYRSISEFLKEPMVSVPIDLQQPYMIEYWIRKFQ